MPAFQTEKRENRNQLVLVKIEREESDCSKPELQNDSGSKVMVSEKVKGTDDYEI